MDIIISLQHMFALVSLCFPPQRCSVQSGIVLSGIVLFLHGEGKLARLLILIILDW